jgi:hypothetical protein
MGSAHQDALILSAISARVCAQRQLFTPKDVAVGMSQALHFQGTAYCIHNEISIWTIYSEIKIIRCKSIKQLINLMIRDSEFSIFICIDKVGSSASATESSLHYCGGAPWLLFIHMEAYTRGSTLLYK